jgi:acetyl-CoA decarbonylase/synthase complex subunit gamma
LAGPGVAAHKVKEATGFQVVYGPVRAADIKPFLESDLKATDRMRRVTFNLRERLALIPYELVHGAKWALAVALVFLALSGVSRSGFSIDDLSAVGPASVAVALLAYVAGVVLPPILLPWLPGRSFSLKGLWVGLLADIALIASVSVGDWHMGSRTAIAGWLLIIPATTSFLAMNLTGCSTYTSLSGVKWEMKRWLPWQIGAASVGMILWIVGRFV